MTRELLRQPDKYLRLGFLHQPWDLLWEPFTSSQRGRVRRGSRRGHRAKWHSAQV